ncbi:uncharacterized protein LOC6556930 [Drosophila grimshawi]|uniref:GH14537 n=1 Tax=Drosophila grimshawi TaxID=7222 RepID=B4IZ14_DROGR|nr:uncharacterized protein LOC6556930 [Drosophila grimshawi]EDV97722.1 GH14537 [Drosophila grimshawi]
MNLGALARSLSNSLRLTLGSKKQLQTPSESSSTPSVRLAPSSSICSRDPAQEDRLAQAVAQINQRRQPYKQTVELILDKVSELEHTLYEDQQHEFQLRMAVERQTERIHELNFSLDTEKQRNNRLVQLLRGVDTESSSDSEPETQLLNGMRLHSRDELHGSISPLLMQQRYEELSASNRQTHRQLAKKDKALKLLKCDLEVLRGKYDSMYDDYRSEQRRLETLCGRYLHMQQKKKQQIFILKETLGYASECLFHAQVTIENCARGADIDEHHLTTFNQNMELFMRALRNCCCLRKLRKLQQDADEVDKLPAPSVGDSSNCRDPQVTAQKKRRLRKRSKH